MDYKTIGKIVLIGGMLGLSASAFADNSVPANFSVLATNISSLELQILKIVQIVVTLAGILLAFRGVIHLKQHAHGSPQEKHLPKGLANIVFAAILFMVVPLIHMLVGSLTQGVGNSDYNTDWASGANTAGGLVSSGS